MSENTRGAPHAGIGLQDLPEIYRELYDVAVRSARDRCDPHTDPDGFIEALWTELATLFDLEPHLSESPQLADARRRLEL